MASIPITSWQIEGKKKKQWQMGFPESSVRKESTCNAEDPGLIPGSGRSAGEDIGYPLQYSWASLVAQLVKNPPAMQETWVGSLGWEDPLENGNSTHFSTLAWRIPWTVYSPWGCKVSDMTEWLSLSVTDFIFLNSKITGDGDCSHKIKRHLLVGRKIMTNLDSTLKNKDITLPTKVHIIKAVFFPVVMYVCESWTIKKADCQRIGSFKSWC